ncbi:YHYH domain-containing protein [Pseudoxanthomonas gei]|uniref:YHYH domain-containing protein n=2 Tax=Pseudoxanthomonas gei TaxID=1383030 RepID=A0ABX0AIF4_9GAMM|nr:YHYH domain-containing protein [Pseudoxanthomonas gei]
MKPTILLLLVLPALAGNAWAHGGGLNKDGCHNDRKHGGYHCHRGSAPAPVQQRYQPSDQPAPPYQPSSARQQGGRVFANCAEARAAGAAPVRRGDAGYGTHLDRDGDGVGCEPYRGR